jgi:cation transport regulator
MPYRTNSDLPPRIRSHLPEHAQSIFREAFNSAFVQYANPKRRRTSVSREVTANRVAWAAVKRLYKKADGHWVSIK